MRNVPRLPHNEDGQLDRWAWPGGYTLLYFLHPSSRYGPREEVLCASCATRASREGSMTCETHDEGEPIECDRCGWHLHSTYGIPSESWSGMTEDEARDQEEWAAEANLALLRARIPGIMTMPEGLRKRARLHKIQRRAWDELKRLSDRSRAREEAAWVDLGLRL